MATRHTRGSVVDRRASPAITAIAGIVVAATTLIAPMLAAQAPGPLDDAAYAEAIERGRAGEPPGNDPFVMRLRVARDAETLDVIEDAPFSFFIQTPWSMVSELAALAAADPAHAPAMITKEQANARLVSVEVLPGRIASTADAIFHVVLRRGQEEFRPATVRIVPHRVEDQAGARHLLTAGSFTFPFRAFDGTAPVTIVFVGRQTSFEWTMTADEIRSLR